MTDAGREVALKILLYLGLRAARDGGMTPDEPFTFARPFAMAWCELSTGRVKHGMAELPRVGFIKDTGERIGRAIVWRAVTVRQRDDEERKAT